MSMQNNKIKKSHRHSKITWLGALLLTIQMSCVWASDLSITELNFSSLAGDKIQIEIEMDGEVAEPKIFQTDNPARIALDFFGVKSNLAKKKFPINQGAASAVYVVGTAERTRVVINLTKSVPYESRVEGNKIFIVLTPINSDVAEIKQVERKGKKVDQKIISLLPEQSIENVDFRRGPRGEGRLLLQLSNENTVVDVQNRGGKVILNFLNTRIPDRLLKTFDVADFATPVQKIEAQENGAGVSIVISTVDGNYDYSSYQSEGLFTVDFLPITAAEKEALLKEKFPYIGNKLSLNFQNIEVRSVLQILADFTELNIIAADSVGGNVSLRLNDVPWDQALDIILKSKGLGKRQSGNVILVAPIVEITKIEKEELEAQKVVELLEPLKTEYIQINYATSEDLRDILMGNGSSNNSNNSNNSSNNSNNSSYDQYGGDDSFRLISPRGTVITDERTNTLIVKDTAEQLEEVRKLIKVLDVPVRQVMIEARVVIAKTTFLEQLGVEFGVAYRGTDFNMHGRGVDNPGGGGLNNESLLSDLAGALMASGPGALAMTLSDGANYILNMEIQANQLDGNAELLSNPRVMATDRMEATIKQGTQIPYQTNSQDGTFTEFVDAVLELNVTPQITPDGSVIMDLNVKKDAPGDRLIGADSLPIDTREVKTTAQVGDGETIVLGGIFESEDSHGSNSVPWMSDLPGIGWLFENSEVVSGKRELLIFITPKIVKNSLSAR